MDIEKDLILVKGVDKTEEIVYCKFNPTRNNWSIKYVNSSQYYNYRPEFVRRLKNPKIIHPKNSLVFENDKPLFGIKKIQTFGPYTRIIFHSGDKRICQTKSVKIEQSSLGNKKANNCFAYLKELAQNISNNNEDGERGFLSRQYGDISYVSPKSVLAKYLEKKPLNREKDYQLVIFPFGFNNSQKSATVKAMNEQISVIEGPPGTGKTQTILNIIASALVNNKTVAVVSNNNSATSNVVEKLEKKGLGFFAAFLGNQENQKKFFEEQPQKNIPNMEGWALPEEEIRSLKFKLVQTSQKLTKMLQFQNRQAVLKQELSELKTEFVYFEKYYSESNAGGLKNLKLKRLSSNKLLNLLLDYIENTKTGKLTFKHKLYLFFAYRIFNMKFYSNRPEAVIPFLQRSYYHTKINELQNDIEVLAKMLESYRFKEEMEKYTAESMKLFKAILAQKYEGTAGRNIYKAGGFRKNFSRFIKDYPVVLSTTHSLRNSCGENYLFDYVIIDEASQVDVVSGALALSCAKNAVIVGDKMQLPHVVPDEVKIVTNRIFETYSLDKAYNYAENSLLASILELYNNVPRTLLKEHYRCHPKIIGFCNKKYYNDELVVLKNEETNDKPMVLYKTVKGNHARGRTNQRQIDVIFDEIIPDQKIDLSKTDLGIVSPYRPQADEIQRIVGMTNIEADTVHKYQGREKDIIILTTVANKLEQNDFADNPNLINVAVSRAIDKLIVVTAEGSEEWQGTNVGDLVKYIQYNNFEVIKSRINSVFDLLYSSYSDRLLALLKKNRKVSQYPSEILLNIIIEKILIQPEFQSLGHVLHQPLRMLIKDPSLLSQEEQKYAMNILTHVDFMIYSKLDKLPVLAVEVDGHRFHANNPVQLKRDEMKDRILEKYGIPLIRLKTTGSQEEKRLREKLGELLGVKDAVSQ